MTGVSCVKVLTIVVVNGIPTGFVPELEEVPEMRSARWKKPPMKQTILMCQMTV